MKVTIYTINDCKFSQAEKEYLKKNNVPFEEKNLETNRDYLTEMLKVSDNFAGTPVTKVEKDGGEIMVLKGFTQDEFAKALDLAPSAEVTPNAETPKQTSTPTPPMPQAPTATPPVAPISTPSDQPKDTQATNAPDMTIESLSEPAVSPQPTTSTPPPQPTTAPAKPEAPINQMSTPSQPDMNTPKTPETPVNPLENQEVGPISLDMNTTTPAPAVTPVGEAPTTPKGAQTPPQTPPQTSPQTPPPVGEVQPTEEKPKNTEGLDSVLQNLQSQVKTGEASSKDTPKT